MKSVLLVLLFVANFFVASFPSTLSEKEFECFSQEKIYHKATDKCYKLLTTGPCRKGYWFVLEKPKETFRGTPNATIKAKCMREYCPDGEYYWSKTNSCVQAKDKKRLCSDAIGEELLTNVFGEGECVCTRDPPRARFRSSNTKRCYPLYTQGPCPSSQVFGYLSSSGVATCLPDPCYAESMYRKRNGLLGKDSVLAAWNDGTCYELGTQGPCPQGLIFKVHPKIKTPNCGSLLNQIFDGHISCAQDVNGICQKKANQKKRSTADKFMKELTSMLNKKK